MSRSFDDIDNSDVDGGRDDRVQSLLRDPVRTMPESLRSRLLAIPGAAFQPADSDEIDRLYAVARSAEADDAKLQQESLRTTPLRAAVVRLLAAVFRDARTVRPLPERLAEGLRAVRRTAAGSAMPARSAWKTRWITEPRWAAAACWLLAFALTLGTGDAVAGWLDAPTKLHARSTHWAARASDAAGAVWIGAWTEASAGITAGYDFVRARTVAFGVQAEAWGERAIRDVGATWDFVSNGLAPQVQDSFEPRPQESKTTNPGDSSPEEARNDR